MALWVKIRAAIKRFRTTKWPSIKHYWTQTGVIPRWQLVTVYSLVIVLGVAGFLSIQDSRRDAIVRTCTEQNIRHDRTVAKLDHLIAKQPAEPDAEQRRKSTVALIDTLAPKIKDCARRAERLVP